MSNEKKWALFVGLPMLLAVVYFGMWASDMYVSEAHFSLRGQQSGGSVELLALFGQASGGTAADVHIIQDYIESPALLQTLDGELGIKAHYQNLGADIFSRLGKKASLEEFNAYFLKQVTVRFDQVAGIVTLQVRAFNPEVAQQICQAILKKSEELVNRLSERAIEDSLALSRTELVRAEQRLLVARKKLRQFREDHQLLDPAAEAGAVQGLVAELRGAAARVRAELAEAKSYMQADSAKVVALAARAQALEGQILKEKIRLTGQEQGTINTVVSQYEQLSLEHDFAQKQFVSAMTSVEASRIRAESQSRYLVSFVEPTLPEEALFPRRAYCIGLSFLASLLFFGLGSLVVAAVREHAGV